MSNGRVCFRKADIILHHFDEAGMNTLYAYYWMNYSHTGPHDKIHEKCMKDLKEIFKSIIFKPEECDCRRRIFCFTEEADEAYFLLWCNNYIMRWSNE